MKQIIIIYISRDNYNSVGYYEEIEKRILSIESHKEKKADLRPTIGIGVLTYNHEKFIFECLQSIYKQRGKFKIKLYIIDDCSTDGTSCVIDKFLKNNNHKNIKVTFIKNEKNKGMISNMRSLINFFKDTDYFTFCEGDDFWITSFRIQKFVKYMIDNPFVSVAFNHFYLYDNSLSLDRNKTHINLNSKFYNSRDLIKGSNFIGNFSCCFYDSSYLNEFKDNIYDLTLYDFLFNTIYSNYGFIGNLNEYLSVYRFHGDSLWSSINETKRYINLYKYINEYNLYTNFIYDKEYRFFQNKILKSFIPSNFIDEDIMIIDNIFPCELSQFNYQEITTYLEYFDKIICLSTGSYMPIFKGGYNLDNEIQRYKMKHNALNTKLADYDVEKINAYNPKLLYFIFFNTVKQNWYYILSNKKPFIFELYPGGGFAFDDSDCDYMLKAIMSSKYFKKVIVTQKIVRDYLLKKNLCKKNQIELINGVVMPIEGLEKDYNVKHNYGFEKENLDIVFMAHKYTEKGVDKGYDIFIEIAKKIVLTKKNVKFHVVGGFCENDIDVSDISDNIEFYGNMPSIKFDDFFIDKDIILSPNTPNKICPGSFDGFPTASCTEAGLRKTAMFCTDPLSMNTLFEEKKEIEIIEHDVDSIIEMIYFYYDNPLKLKELGENGSKAIKRIYSYDNQIKPRIELLNSILKRSK